MIASGPLPIDLLPGMDGTGELLADLRGRLSPHRPVTVVAYPTDQPLGHEALAAFVSDRLPEGRFVILGESFSGPIAIEIAARMPERVAGLVLASTFARHPLPRALVHAIPLVDVARLPRRLIEGLLLGRHGTPKLKAQLAAILAKLPRGVMQARARDTLQVDVRARLRAIVCPALCLVGRHDRLIGRRCVADLRSGLRDATFVEFDAPHMLLETHAAEAASAIERFCATLIAHRRGRESGV